MSEQTELEVERDNLTRLLKKRQDTAGFAMNVLAIKVRLAEIDAALEAIGSLESTLEP